MVESIDDKLRLVQATLMSSTLNFTKYFFKERFGRGFVVNSHHIAICDALDRVLRGECKKLAISIAPRFGKAIDIDTEVLTDSGFKKAKDILITDRLLGSNGLFTNIEGIYPQGITDLYKITFSDGSSCNVCSEHLWEVKNRDRKDSEVKRTKDLIIDLYATDGRKKWQIPVVKNNIDAFNENDLKIPPYLLGCWLGDGSSYKAEFTTMDDEIKDAFFSIYEEGIRTHQNSGRAYTFGVKSNFIQLLRSYNLLGDKHIPNDYLFSSISDRLDLLQGLMDTDGTCNKNGNVSFSTKSDKLAEGIKYLINSLGGVHRTYMKLGIYYDISFRLPDGLVPFKLERKINLMPKYNARLKPRRFIQSIEKINDSETICFKVSAKDSLFAITKDLILTHNTELAVKNFIALGLAFNPSSKFIHLSYSGSLAEDNSETVRDFVDSEIYRRIFPYVELSKSSAGKAKWMTTAGGMVYATATGGQITGMGAGEVDREIGDAMNSIGESKFAGAIIIDDPLKPDDALSDLKRERVNERFENTIRSRTNSRDTPIVVIGQRLHSRDLIGYLKETEGDEWEFLDIPCITTDEFGNESALWEFKMTLAELNQIRQIDENVFETQYQQNPQDLVGKLLPLSTLKFWNFDNIPISSIVFKFAVGDPANTGGDYYSIPIMHVAIIEGKLLCFVKDVIHSKEGIEIINEKLIDKSREHFVEEVFLEVNGIGAAAFMLLKRDMANTTKVKPFTVTIPKEARILSNSEFVKQHFIFDEKYLERPEYRRFIDHVTSYDREGQNKHKKDAIDSLASAANILKIKYKNLLYG
jgi:predicted phage terminase large subunit-like protein